MASALVVSQQLALITAAVFAGAAIYSAMRSRFAGRKG
jgi:hypothetical protein